MTWKGYNFDIINKLDEEGYIRQSSHRSKSVKITDKGTKLSCADTSVRFVTCTTVYISL
jgi:predicted transcriptional regulator